MPSIKAKEFRSQFQKTMAKGGRMSADDVAALEKAAKAIKNATEKSAAKDVVALVKHDHILDESEVKPARSAFTRLLGTQRLPADLERVLRHAVPVPNVRVKSYHLAFDFSSTKKGATSFPAHAKIELEKKSGDTCILEVDPDRLDIDEVKVRGKHVPFEVKQGRLIVHAKGAVSLDISYKVTPTEDTSSFGLIREKYSGRMWTLTWPYNTGALFPSASQPDDGATAKVTVRVAAGQKAIGPGVQQKDGSFALHAEVPAYAIAFTVGKMTDMHVATVDGYSARTIGLGNKMSPATRKAVREHTAESMAWFSKKYGECVFGKMMNIVEVIMEYGGMEHAAAIAIAVGQSKKDTIEAAVHETAHHWFGDGIRIRHWGELWMSEGFTDYATWRFFGDRDGKDAMFAYFDDAKKELADQLKKGIRQPLDNQSHVDPEEGLSWVPYMQGAWMLRMIECKIGTKQLDDLMRAWFQKKKGGSVATTDFVAFAKERGYDFKEFFQAWKELKTIPTFDAHKSIDGSRVDVKLTARGDVPAGIAVPLRIVGKKGETMDVVVEPGKRLKLDVGFSVKSLVWDPERTVLCDVK